MNINSLSIEELFRYAPLQPELLAALAEQHDAEIEQHDAEIERLQDVVRMLADALNDHGVLNAELADAANSVLDACEFLPVAEVEP